MFEYNDMVTRAFSSAQIRDLYVSRKVPRRTEVFIGTYGGASGSRLRHRASMIHRRLPDGSIGESLGMAAETGIALSRAAFLVRTVNTGAYGPLANVYPPEIDSSWREIWPKCPDVVVLEGLPMDDDHFTEAVDSMAPSPTR